MSAIPLEEIFSSYPDIKQECDELQKNYSIEPSYFWDEANAGGWIEYSVMGVSIGAGIATSGFIQSYFSKAEESAWQATKNLFKHVAKKYNRKKMFFYATVKAKNSRVVVLLDDMLLKSEDLTNQALILLQKMLRLIEEDNEFELNPSDWTHFRSVISMRPSLVPPSHFFRLSRFGTAVGSHGSQRLSRRVPFQGALTAARAVADWLSPKSATEKTAGCCACHWASNSAGGR